MKTMTKTLTGLTAAAALALTIPTALADTSRSGLVQGGALNLREEPSMSAKVLGQYPAGTLVEIIYHGDFWHTVEIDGKTGYMKAEFISDAEHPQGAKVKTNSGIGLNLREEPNTSAAIITSVKNGGSVTVLQKGRDWSRVAVNGKEGFMATKYLVFGSGSSTSATVGKVAVVNNPKATQVLNLRKAPNLNAKVLDYFYNGTRVTILKDEGAWVKVQVEDGQIGYMMEKFLKVTDETAAVKPFQAKVMNPNGGSYVNFRKGGSLQSSILKRIPVGASITVLEHGADWCKVDIDGVVGYVSTWFLTW